MTLNKKDRLTYNGKVYEVAGRWTGSIVLSPVNQADEQCLIYTPEEIEELLQVRDLQKGTRMMRALFGRKVSNLDELKEITESARKRGQQGQPYTITREVVLGANDFKALAADFFEDQPWITKADGGINEAGEIRCIRVVNKDTGETVLVNNEGYEYYAEKVIMQSNVAKELISSVV